MFRSKFGARLLDDPLETMWVNQLPHRGISSSLQRCGRQCCEQFTAFRTLIGAPGRHIGYALRFFPFYAVNFPV